LRKGAQYPKRRWEDPHRRSLEKTENILKVLRLYLQEKEENGRQKNLPMGDPGNISISFGGEGEED